MNFFRLLFFVGCFLIALSSCQTNKIAYGNSYYFKQTPKYIAPKVDPVSSVQFYADVEENTPFQIQTTSRLDNSALLKQPSAATKIHAGEEYQAQLTKAEKKAMLKEKRAQRKYLRTEVKKFWHAHDRIGASDRPNGLIKAGIITGIAGIVMLLIGVLASASVLTTLGGIFLAVGVVLILLRIL